MVTLRQKILQDYKSLQESEGSAYPSTLNSYVIASWFFCHTKILWEPEKVWKVFRIHALTHQRNTSYTMACRISLPSWVWMSWARKISWLWPEHERPHVFVSVKMGGSCKTRDSFLLSHNDREKGIVYLHMLVHCESNWSTFMANFQNLKTFETWKKNTYSKGWK